jgi:lysophospholipase L1-like esterase
MQQRKYSMKLIAIHKLLLLGLLVCTNAFSQEVAHAEAGVECNAIGGFGDAVRMLTIGNSFANDARRMLPRFFQAGDKRIHFFPANLGGADFARHVRHLEAFEADPDSRSGRPYRNQLDRRTGERRDFSLREALESYDWDVVTIQQRSNDSYDAATFAAAHQLIDYIRRYAPDAEIIIHQTWAFREDYEGFADGNFSVEAMYAGLSEAYSSLAKEYGLRIIPVGDAFFRARQTPRWTYQADADYDFENPTPGILPDQSGSLHIGYLWRDTDSGPQLHLDFKHANEAGQYLAAAVWYAFFFGEPVPESASFPDALTAEAAADLRRIAWETVEAMRAGGGKP